MPAIKKHQTVFDAAIMQAGDVSAVMQMALSAGISITDDATGADVQALAVIKRDVVDFYGKGTADVATAMQQTIAMLPLEGITFRASATTPVTVRDMQTVLDACLFMSGSTASVIELALLNGLSVTDDFENGQVLQEITVVSNKIMKALKQAKPATAIKAGSAADVPEGIGYWIIEQNFIVS